MQKLVNEFLLGADPEFVVRKRDGRYVYLPGYVPQYGELGYDHGGRVAEVRPKPSQSAYEVCERIQKIINGNPNLQEAGKWEAGAYKGEQLYLGGHIHFGLDSTAPRSQVGVKNLDQITKMLEELDVLPRRECVLRRDNPYGYGRWGSVRNDFGYQGAPDPTHFEYRTMCSWLFHPAVAMMCLTLGKLAMRFPYAVQERLGGVGEPRRVLEDLICKGADRYGDVDCVRVKELILPKLKPWDPTVDFRERWGVRAGEPKVQEIQRPERVRLEPWLGRLGDLMAPLHQPEENRGRPLPLP